MFRGFSPETIEFLWGIRFNNEKSWFEAHKQDYLTHLYQPMKELGADVQDKMLERFPKSQLNLKISRIYRDARRLFGRGPYKDHLWLTLFRWDGGEEGAAPPCGSSSPPTSGAMAWASGAPRPRSWKSTGPGSTGTASPC